MASIPRAETASTAGTACRAYRILRQSAPLSLAFAKITRASLAQLSHHRRCDAALRTLAAKTPACPAKCPRKCRRPARSVTRWFVCTICPRLRSSAVCLRPSHVFEADILHCTFSGFTSRSSVMLLLIRCVAVVHVSK
jgi:hypothetical protein